MPLSVAEAAERLGLSERRLRALIAAGRLHAERVGGIWVLDEADVARHDPGASRALSERSAWALLHLAAGLPPEVTRSEVSRARKRLRRILVSEAPERLLRAWLSSRAERKAFRVSPRDLTDLRSDGRLLVSGVSHPSSGISAAEVAEGYVLEHDVPDLVREFLLVEAPDGRGNAILHVTRRPVDDGMSPLLIAADLADHRSPREDSRSAEQVRSLT